jgi:single-strand DNA-binding protein
MAKGVNRVILIGNLGRDPETRYTQSGSAVTNFSLATTDTWTKDGQTQERTEWHNISTFNRLAEIAGEYLRKGSKVFIEGSLRTSTWEKEGQTRYKTEVLAKEIQMLDQKGQSQQPRPEQPQQTQQPQKPAVLDDDWGAPF